MQEKNTKALLGGHSIAPRAGLEPEVIALLF
jgi:hypothetical protein